MPGEVCAGVRAVCRLLAVAPWRSLASSFRSHLYCRVSAHIYNETGDYEKLADAVARALGWTTHRLSVS